MTTKQTSLTAFNAYKPARALAVSTMEEVDWYERDDRKVIGVVVRCRVDNDFGWVVLAEDAGKFICVGLEVSIASLTQAADELRAAMDAYAP